jgi:hypothetical protein
VAALAAAAASVSVAPLASPSRNLIGIVEPAFTNEGGIGCWKASCSRVGRVALGCTVNCGANREIPTIPEDNRLG